MKLNIYGFSFLKDGIRFDYPFVEAFSSLLGLTKKVYIALGQNDDGTAERLAQMEGLDITPTIWDMERMGDGGLIFSEQTNIALGKVRENHGKEEDAWAIYLQSDEVIHEKDYERLRNDIAKANEEGCDAVRLRYFHFWKSHYQIATNKRWYPCEIRAIKLNSSVVNHGDAQGFRGFTKVYDSDVYVHHYGHVRDEEKKKEKQKFLIRSIRASEKFNKYMKREQKAFSETKTLPLLIEHPQVMKERIERMGESFSIEVKPVVHLAGRESDFDPSLIGRIAAEKVIWISHLKEVPKTDRSQAVILEPRFMERILYPSRVPPAMESPLARPWDRETWLALKLSEKGIFLKSN